jgi:hypothetical protein
MNRINCEVRNRTAERGVFHFVGLFLFVFCLVALWGAGSTYVRVGDLERRIQTLEQQQKNLELKLEIVQLKGTK